jgi:Flp pilus assembly protein CpaB
VVKKVLTLMMVVGMLVAFASVSVAMGICGGPKAIQAQANAEPASTPADQVVVAQAEMTEDTSPVTTDENEEENTENN